MGHHRLDGEKEQNSNSTPDRHKATESSVVASLRPTSSRRILLSRPERLTPRPLNTQLTTDNSQYGEALEEFLMIRPTRPIEPNASRAAAGRRQERHVAFSRPPLLPSSNKHQRRKQRSKQRKKARKKEGKRTTDRNKQRFERKKE